MIRDMIRASTRKSVAALAVALASTVSGCSWIGYEIVKTRPSGAEDYATASIPTASRVERGVAAWDGEMSAAGRSAAHRRLLPGSWARITNADTGQSVTVQITRKLVGAGRVDIELSRDAAIAVGALHEGYANVLIEPIDARQASASERLAVGSATPHKVETVAYAPAAATPKPAASPGWDPDAGTASVPRVAGAPRSARPAGRNPVGPATRYLQIGSFRVSRNAHRAVKRAMSQGLAGGAFGDAFVSDHFEGGALFHRVRIGPIEDAALAAKALEKARLAGYHDAALVRP